MTDRKRDPLPKDYQFGDAGLETKHELALRKMAEAEKLPRLTEQQMAEIFRHWNVIEGEHHDPAPRTLRRREA